MAVKTLARAGIEFAMDLTDIGRSAV